MNKEYSKPIYGNCWFGMIYLLLSRRCKKVIFLSGSFKLIPHVACITKKGYLLAFGVLKNKRAGKLYPFWYKGRYRGCKRSFIQHIFEKRIILGKLS